MTKSGKLTPTAIIEATRRPAKWDGCVITHSEGLFNLLNPRSGDVVLEDIAYGLAYKNRYGGQLGPLTVAEHSVMVCDIIERLWPASNQMLAGLLHDACEAYTHDIQAPVRKFVRVSMPDGSLITWGDMERRVNTTVAKALDIDQDFYSSNEVAAADILAASIEKKALVKGGPTWGLPKVPQELEGIRIRNLSATEAYDLFLSKYEQVRIKTQVP
jgi:hypothetical protein